MIWKQRHCIKTVGFLKANIQKATIRFELCKCTGYGPGTRAPSIQPAWSSALDQPLVFSCAVQCTVCFRSMVSKGQVERFLWLKKTEEPVELGTGQLADLLFRMMAGT